MSRFSATKAALLFALISVTTASLTGMILNPLIAGTEGALKWQPVLDWDKDTSAIDSNGLAQKLLNTNWESAHMDLPDGRFQEKLEIYMPKQARADGFTARD
ncbi:hypothetical protein J4E93_001988 [Alternaria ventricosa]|uniref:uncharacterized protein n=1 Tax=Alternaria ventricosa TaxID=1187951 RepID=UPI0020C355C0|nr:uncharacterized protein J4E93_001988 [Alternaria ventricosa]KAI4651792.1 hypothetical protein J4E93_001988 [Alternaria ventricosa]